ncbi:Ig-like domain-containing protein [Sneathiella sp.]|uniref:Ig-like domain-containing protein n=1 Tax=Sneathiella sp. TaxID=1964365 RepID=UPI003568CECC
MKRLATAALVAGGVLAASVSMASAETMVSMRYSGSVIDVSDQLTGGPISIGDTYEGTLVYDLSTPLSSTGFITPEIYETQFDNAVLRNEVHFNEDDLLFSFGSSSYPNFGKLFSYQPTMIFANCCASSALEGIAIGGLDFNSISISFSVGTLDDITQLVIAPDLTQSTAGPLVFLRWGNLGNEYVRLEANEITVSVAPVPIPVPAEVTPVPTVGNDPTPDYTFSSDQAGTISYGGDVSSVTTAATAGNNTVTFNTLAERTYTNCTISVTNAAGTTSSPLGVSSFTIDLTDANVDILNAPAEVTMFDPFNLTLQFSEDVTGFVVGDITVSGGHLSNFTSVDGNTFTVDITPGGTGDITIDVAADVAQDAAGNGNTAADQVIVRAVNVVKQTQAVVRNFLSDRADQITADDPELAKRLFNREGSSGMPVDVNGVGLIAVGLSAVGLQGEGLGGGPEVVTVKTSLHQVIAAAGKSRKVYEDSLGVDRTAYNVRSDNDQSDFDVWIEARYTRVDVGSRTGDLGLFYLGADYLMNPDLLIGAIVQFDVFNQRDDALGASADGVGWLAGPYFVARVTDNLVLEGRGAWGQSDNNVSPLGTYTDDFDTDRLLLKSALTGNFIIEDLQINPMVSVIYLEETQRSYTDTLGFVIPSQRINLGRVKFGPTVSRTFQMPDGVLVTPSAAIHGLWDFKKAKTVTAQGLTIDTAEFRARATGSLSISTPDGLSINAKGFYDGIGSSNLMAYGGEIDITIPLN